MSDLLQYFLQTWNVLFNLEMRHVSHKTSSQPSSAHPLHPTVIRTGRGLTVAVSVAESSQKYPMGLRHDSHIKVVQEATDRDRVVYDLFREIASTQNHGLVTT